MITLSYWPQRPYEWFYFCWRRPLPYGGRLTWIQVGPFQLRAWKYER